MSKKIIKKKSKISNAGNGMFAKKIFHRGDIVCEYFGMIVSKDTIYESYMRDKENYITKIHPYVRDLDDKRVIIGKENKDIYKSGVLVNDGAMLKTDEIEDMKKYINESLSKANVEIVIKGDKALYLAKKRIKKGEECYAHYGLGYWLLGNGVDPKMIAIMDRDMGGFDRLYPK